MADDGGPAFPVGGLSGMTVRQLYAGQAMASTLGQYSWESIIKIVDSYARRKEPPTDQPVLSDQREVHVARDPRPIRRRDRCHHHTGGQPCGKPCHHAVR